MRTMIVDTDVVSYIYKKDTRAEKYEPHLVNEITSISFITLAELEIYRPELGRAETCGDVDDSPGPLRCHRI